jgi:hypothetical protein
MYRTMFKGFQPFLEADDGLNVAGTGEEVQEVAEPAVEEGVEEQEVAEPVETGRTESDAAFAQMRRDLEAANRRIAEMEQTAGEYEDALGLFFQGDNKAAQARAYHDDIPLERVIADMEAAREKKTLEERLQAVEQERNNLLLANLKAQDLKALHDAGYKVENLDDLGEDFFAYRGMGIDAVRAYEGLQLKKGKAPKSMGAVKTATPTRDTFTREEVEAMSSADRVKNYDKIRKSMAKWK